MGKIVKTALLVTAVAVISAATGNPLLGVKVAEASFLGLSGYAAIAASGAVLGSGLGLLSSVLAPSVRDMGDQSRQKAPIVNSVDTRKAIYGRARIGGAEVYIEEYDTSAGNDIPNDTLIFVRAVADHPVHAFGPFQLSDQTVAFSANAALGDFAGSLWLYTHDGRQTAADAALVAAGQGWTNAHKGNGIAYFVVKALFDPDRFPYGADELRRCSIEVLGKRLYDPRFDSTVAGSSGPHRLTDPATWEYSTNPALCILDFLLDPDDALGNAVPIEEIDMPAIVAAASACATLVPVKGGGSIPQYSLNGVIDCARPKLENLRLMLTAMSGRMQWLGGKLVIHAGLPGFMTGTILGEDDIIAVTFSATLPTGQRYNEVRGTFIDPAAGFESGDFPAFVDSDAQGREGEVVMNLNLPLCHDHREAQRHAKIALHQANQPVMTIETGAKGLLVKPMDIVLVRHSALGFDGSEDFRVVEHETLPPSAGKPLTVRLGLVGEAPTAFDWTPETEELDRNANPSLRDVTGREALAVTGLTATPIRLVSTAGSQTAAFNITWNAPGPAVASTVIEVRKHGTLPWRPGGIALRGDNDCVVEVPESMEIDIRARHVLASGLVGPENTIVKMSLDVVGDGGISWDDAYKGAWDAGTLYAKGDVVTWKGSSYVYVAAAATTGHQPDDSVYWRYLAEAARLAFLSSTGNSISYDGEGNLDPVSGQDVTLTMHGQNLLVDLATTTWSAVGDASNPAMGSAAATKQFTPAMLASNKWVKITATCGGISDSVTIYRIRSGANAYAAYLDNEAHVVPADANGNVLSYTGAGGQFIIEKGALMSPLISISPPPPTRKG